MVNTLDILTDLLKELPGIGPRQARRLAYFLVRKDKAWVQHFARALTDARSEVATCSLCMRLFPAHGGTVCGLCGNAARDAHTLMLVEKDVDLENIERTGVYKGRYFVLGGTTSLLDKEPHKKVRIQALEKRLGSAEEVHEVIFALSATTEGEDTISFVRERIEPITKERGVTLTLLGRGLSTGTELEYVDADTLKSALRGRG